MLKMKKVLFSLLSVTSATLAVASFNASAFSNLTYYQNPSTFSKVKESTYLSMQCYPGWGAVSYTGASSNCFKYMSITSYYYQYGEYVQQGRKVKHNTDPTVTITDNVQVNGSTQKVDYYGAVYNNSSSNSGIKENGHIIVYRP